ncbi:MAG: type II toxin-antitoxin system antitoxin SocA domain-containing protein [Pseudomonadota bacterium]
MPNYDPRAIANEFIKLNGGNMNQMKLQKLVYISHGWNLAINHEPLVSARIEAWDGGPVMRDIWNHLRDYGLNAVGGLMGASPSSPFKAPLNANEQAVISHVWRKYSGYSGLELSEMTHEPGTPWSNAYFGRGRNAALVQSDIQQHFVELALAGRAEQA